MRGSRGTGELELAEQRSNPDLVKARLEKMAQIEEEIYQAATQTVQATQAAQEIDPSRPNPPESWVAEFGQEAAMKRYKVAVASWLPQNQAPFFLHMNERIMLGTQRVRALRAEAGAIRELNVKIALPAPTSAEHPGPVQYEVRELDEGT